MQRTPPRAPSSPRAASAAVACEQLAPDPHGPRIDEVDRGFARPAERLGLPRAWTHRSARAARVGVAAVSVAPVVPEQQATRRSPHRRRRRAVRPRARPPSSRASLDAARGRRRRTSALPARQARPRRTVSSRGCDELEVADREGGPAEQVDPAQERRERQPDLELVDILGRQLDGDAGADVEVDVGLEPSPVLDRAVRRGDGVGDDPLGGVELAPASTSPYSSARLGKVAACDRAASCRNSGHVSAAARGPVPRRRGRRAARAGRPRLRRRRSSRSGGRRRSSGARRIRPTVSPSSRGSGTPAPARTDQSRRDVLDGCAHRPDGVEQGQSGKTPSIGTEPQRVLSPTVSQAADGQADRAAGVRADAEVAQPAASAAALPRARAAGGLPGMRGLWTVPYQGFWPSTLHANSGRFALPTTRARGEHALRRRCACGVGHVVGVDPRAVRRADAGRVDQVLDEQGAAGERPVGRVRRSGSSSQVIAAFSGSSSLVHAGTAQRRRPRSGSGNHERRDLDRVDAGRVSPKTSWRTGLTSGRSSTSVRKTVTLTTSAKRAAGRREHVAACSAKTLRRLGDDVVAADELARSSSTGTMPLTNRRPPARTASVKCEIGSAWPATRILAALRPDARPLRRFEIRRGVTGQRRAPHRSSRRRHGRRRARSPGSRGRRRVTRPTAPRPGEAVERPEVGASSRKAAGARAPATESRKPMTTTTAPSGGHAVRRHLAVALDRLRAVRADDEARARGALRVLARRD